MDADYYDGHSARRQPVTLTLGADGRLRLEGLETPRYYPLAQVVVEPRVGAMPRVVRLPDGGMLQSDRHDLLDALLRRRGEGRGQRLVYRLENGRMYVLAALVLAAGFTWLMVAQGLPWLARQTALALPADMDAALGRQGLELLEQGGVLAPSRLSREERQRVERVFAVLQAGEEGLTLVLRRSERLGANALALPAGIIVVTDDLVRRLEDEQELLAVLAHERGHVVGRHTLRQFLQDSVSTLVLASWTGDVQAFSSLASGLPTLLLHLNYTRDFEREADRFAVETLRARGVPVERMASALEKLVEKESAGSFLSTHPGWEERRAGITTPGS